MKFLVGLLYYGTLSLSLLSFSADAYQCFSPHMTATVEGSGQVAMKDVRVGDRVLTGSGQYQQIYTINHMHGSLPTKYVQIQSTLEDEEPLELTAMHMVFVEHSDVPIPAAHVQVGHSVRTRHGKTHKVTNVTHVTRNGLFSPQTMDGTIVVNGVIASTYCSFLGSEYIEIGGYQLMSAQSFVHLAMTPVRSLCTAVSCTPEPHNNNIIAQDSHHPAPKKVDIKEEEQKEHLDGYTKAGISLLEFSVQQPSLFQIIIFMVMLMIFALIAFSFSPCGFIVVLLIVYRVSLSRRKARDAAAARKYIPVKTVDIDIEDAQPVKKLDV